MVLSSAEATERVQMTAAEFLALPETNLPIELIDGDIIQITAPELDHQAIVVQWIGLILGLIAEIGGKLYVSPTDVKLDEHNIVQPDVLWLAPNSACQPQGKKRLLGAPDLVIEVLSPSTARKDKVDKFLLYEKHGVREYWIADPTKQTVEVWRLVNAQFDLAGIYGAAESFISTVLGGKTIDLKTVFEGVS